MTDKQGRRLYPRRTLWAATPPPLRRQRIARVLWAAEQFIGLGEFELGVYHKAAPLLLAEWRVALTDDDGVLYAPDVDLIARYPAGAAWLLLAQLDLDAGEGHGLAPVTANASDSPDSTVDLAGQG